MLKTSTNYEINKTKINQLYKTKSFQENMVPMYLDWSTYCTLLHQIEVRVDLLLKMTSFKNCQIVFSELDLLSIDQELSSSSAGLEMRYIWSHFDV